MSEIKVRPLLKIVGISLLAVALIVILSLVTSKTKDNLLKGAPPGLPARSASSSIVNVGVDIESLLFSGSSDGVARNCASRVISTRANPILINFHGTSNNTATTTILSSLEGHFQGASTTVAYDGGLYGCGWWGARSVVAGTTTITIT